MSDCESCGAPPTGKRNCEYCGRYIGRDSSSIIPYHGEYQRQQILSQLSMARAQQNTQHWRIVSGGLNQRPYAVPGSSVFGRASWRNFLVGVTGMNALGVKPQSGKTLSNEEWAATVTDAELEFGKILASAETLRDGVTEVALKASALGQFEIAMDLRNLLGRVLIAVDATTRESIAESRRNK